MKYLQPNAGKPIMHKTAQSWWTRTLPGLTLTLKLSLCFAITALSAHLFIEQASANEAKYKDMLAQLTQRHTQIQKADTDNRLAPQLQEVAKWLQEANFLLGKGEVDRLDGMLRKTEAFLDLYDIQLQYEVAKARADERSTAAQEARARFDEVNGKLESTRRKIEAAKQGAPMPQ